MLSATRTKRARISAVFPALGAISRSTASIVACVVLPVMIVVGGALARCTRWSAFCSAIAAMPAKPVSRSERTVGSANAPKVTASAKNANSSAAAAASRIRSTGSLRAC
jgi:hypothetical protein